VSGKAHVDNPENGLYSFSLEGGANASVNVALVNSGVAVDDSSFNGLDVFIGSDSEPVIHISESLDSAPVAFADISDNKIFHSDTFTHVYIKVTGSIIEVGKGIYGESSAISLLSYTLSASQNIDKAVFSYGYGDYVCEIMS